LNLAAAISIAAAAIAALAGVMSRKLSLAPGWSAQHGFSRVALTAAGYAVCNLATSLHLPDPVVLAASHLQLVFGSLHYWSWIRYSEHFGGRPAHPAARWLTRGMLAGAALMLVPGLVFDGHFKDHPFPPFGVVYRDAIPTAFGSVLMGVMLGVSLLPFVRFVSAWRRGVRHAGLHVLAYGTLLLFGFNDAVATSAPVPAPYLLDTGFVVPILAVYWAVATRFVEEAQTLDRMRARLESEVEARTAELARAEAALSQQERLAALGRFARGVAHEVNNPASVVTANLRWLREATAEGGDEPADVAEVVGESLEAMTRINDLVRKLVDAGRIADILPGGRAPLLDTVRRAVDALRALAPSVVFSVSVAPELWVRTHAEGLSQVLAHLLANAVEAVPAGQAGVVSVTAERRPGTVRVVVTDDGRGMPQDVLRRAFDPFYTTKPEGQGAGLGLAVARGVVEGHGGSLWLESELGRGTRAVFELPEAVAAVHDPVA